MDWAAAKEMMLAMSRSLQWRDPAPINLVWISFPFPLREKPRTAISHAGRMLFMANDGTRCLPDCCPSKSSSGVAAVAAVRLLNSRPLTRSGDPGTELPLFGVTTSWQAFGAARGELLVGIHKTSSNISIAVPKAGLA